MYLLIEKNEKTITLNQQKLLQSPKFGKKTEFTLSSKNGLNESTSPLNQTAQLLNINSKVQITPNNRKQLISTPGSVITSIQNLKGTQSKSPINRKVTFENKTDKSPMIQSKLQISQQQDQRVVLKHTLEKITSQPALLKGSSFVSSQNSSFITGGQNQMQRISSNTTLNNQALQNDQKKKVSFNFGIYCFYYHYHLQINDYSVHQQKMNENLLEQTGIFQF